MDIVYVERAFEFLKEYSKIEKDIIDFCQGMKEEKDRYFNEDYQQLREWERYKSLLGMSDKSDKEVMSLLKKIRARNVYEVIDDIFVIANSWEQAVNYSIMELGFEEERIYDEEVRIDNLLDWYVMEDFDNSRVRDFIKETGGEYKVVYMEGVFVVRLNFKQKVIMERDKEIPYLFAKVD